MKEGAPRALEETGVKDEKVVGLLNISAFRQRILSAKGQNPIDFSFGIYGCSGNFITPEITPLNPNRDEILGCRKDFNPNVRDFYRRPIITLAVIRSLSSELFIPKISDLEELIRVNSQTPFKGVILAECGIRDDKIVEFLFLKPQNDHGTWTSSKMTDEIGRLCKSLPKRKTQDKIELDLANSGFLISRYETSFDFLTTSTGRLKTSFKFA